MTTKLTLTMDDSVISVAKKYARKNGKSLSDLVENYLMALTAKDINEEAISHRITKLMGFIELPDNFDYQKTLSECLSKKYEL